MKQAESRLFSLSTTTQSLIRSFRLARPVPGSTALICTSPIRLPNSRSLHRQETHEVAPSGDKLTFASGKLDEIQDELPDNAPRFVLLSYEVIPNSLVGPGPNGQLQHSDGRKSNPLIMINYVPDTANHTLHTLVPPLYYRG